MLRKKPADIPSESKQRRPCSVPLWDKSTEPRGLAADFRQGRTDVMFHKGRRFKANGLTLLPIHLAVNPGFESAFYLISERKTLHVHLFSLSSPRTFKDISAFSEHDHEFELKNTVKHKPLPEEKLRHFGGYDSLISSVVFQPTCTGRKKAEMFLRRTVTAKYNCERRKKNTSSLNCRINYTGKEIIK